MKIKIGDITKIRTGKLDANAADENGQYPFFTCSKEPLKINTYSYDCECVLVAGNGDLNVKYYNGKFDAYQRTYIIEDDSDGLLFMPYLYFFMESYIDELRKQSIGGVIKYIKLKNLTDALIELPSIEVQRKIVNIISKSKEIISKKENEFELLDELVRARFVEMFGEIDDCDRWKIKIWNEVVTIQNGRDYKKVLVNDGGYPVVGTGGEIARASGYLCPENTIVVGRKGSINNPMLMKEKFWNVDTAFGVIPNSDYLHYQYFYYFCKFYNFMKLNKATTLPSTTKADLLKIKINIPPLELQNQFASFVEEIDKSRSRIQKSLEASQELFDSLMQEYFG
ncbi:restriction endonuclease subunit S [uncultured Catenibacterium sp.]|uniref:restriction endonuclease subunit S n=1 Tax=uncultured Catenibacterium sp. TaxID=286142 RepID=UPI0026193148|nr:restriction endonuclease subunit S [uncultured Catenibacterium sp.]